MQWARAIKQECTFNARRAAIIPRIKTFRRFLKAWLSNRHNWPGSEHWADDDTPMSSDALTVVDYLLFPEVRELLDSPGSGPVTRELLETRLAPVLPELVVRWYWERRQELTDFLRHSLEGKSHAQAVEDPLSLAIYSFDCAFDLNVFPLDICHQQFMTFPAVLSHRCGAVVYKQRGFSDSSYEVLVDMYAAENQLKRGWTTENIIVNKRIIPEMATAIVRACGLDPNTASPADMWACKARLGCEKCWEHPAGSREARPVFSWKGIVSDVPRLQNSLRVVILSHVRRFVLAASS